MGGGNGQWKRAGGQRVVRVERDDGRVEEGASLTARRWTVNVSARSHVALDEIWATSDDR